MTPSEKKELTIQLIRLSVGGNKGIHKIKK